MKLQYRISIFISLLTISLLYFIFKSYSTYAVGSGLVPGSRSYVIVTLLILITHAAIFLFLILWYLDHSVFSRLRSINSDLSFICDHELHDQRISESGDDEIGVNAEGINKLLETFEQCSLYLSTKQIEYKGLVDDMPGMVCRYLPDGTIIFVSQGYTQVFNKTYDDFLGHNFLDIVADDYKIRTRKSYLGLTPDSPISMIENEVILPDNSKRWIEWINRGIFDDHGRTLEYQSIGIDATERKIIESKLINQLEFERLIAELSSELVRAYSHDIDPIMNEALRKLGEYLNVARVYTIIISDDKQRIFNMHEWCSDCVSPRKDAMQDINIEKFPRWSRQIQSFETIKILSTSDIGTEATKEKEYMEERNIKSILLIPIRMNGTLLGCIGFNSTEKREWEDEYVNLITVLSRIMGGIIKHFLEAGD